MNKKQKWDLLQKYQGYTDEALRVLNCDFPVKVNIGGDISEDCLGEFWVEAIEDKGQMRSFQGHINLCDFTKVSKDEIIQYLWMQILIHEVGHALQFRSWEMYDEDTCEDGEEKERDSHHDAEFGIHYARAYEQIVEDEAQPTQEEAMEIIGLTQDKRDAIVESLVKAIEKDQENA